MYFQTRTSIRFPACIRAGSDDFVRRHGFLHLGLHQEHVWPATVAGVLVCSRRWRARVRRRAAGDFFDPQDLGGPFETRGVRPERSRQRLPGYVRSAGTMQCKGSTVPPKVQTEGKGTQTSLTEFNAVVRRTLGFKTCPFYLGQCVVARDSRRHRSCHIAGFCCVRRGRDCEDVGVVR